MKMYRVHWKDSFRIGLYCSNTASHLHNPIRHPSPDCDSLLQKAMKDDVIYGRFRFGFATLDQFASWVYNKDWWQWLDEENYVISEINSPDVRVGYTQAVFDTERYTILRTVRVSQWERLQDATYDKPFEPYVAVQTQSDCDILGALLVSALQLNPSRASDVSGLAEPCAYNPLWYFQPDLSD